MQATIVFQRIWEALNERGEDGGRRYRYIILQGSSRSSKTHSLLQTLYIYAFQHAKKRISVWRDTAKDCRDTVGHDMNRVFPDLEGWRWLAFNQTKFTFSFPTKSSIEVTGTDDPKKVHGYQGNVIWLNEPYEISRDTFDQLDMRTADVVFIDWNPKQSHWAEDIAKDPRALVIHSTFRDNPFCPPEQRLKILSYQPVSWCAAARDRLLAPGADAGQNELLAKAYDLEANTSGLTPPVLRELARCRENEYKRTASAFNWEVYGLGLKAEKPHRIFHWEEISDDDYLKLKAKLYYGVDWGTVDPWGIVEAKYYDGALYLHERNYKSENQVRAELSPVERSIVAGAETEAEHRESTGIVTFYFDKLGIRRDCDIVCDSNRPRKGSALRRAGWRSIPAAKGAGSIRDGIDALNNLRVYYTASSANLRYEQENYSWEVDKDGTVLDETQDANNHLIDPVRYIVQHLQALGIIRSV